MPKSKAIRVNEQISVSSERTVSNENVLSQNTDTILGSSLCFGKESSQETNNANDINWFRDSFENERSKWSENGMDEKMWYAIFLILSFRTTTQQKKPSSCYTGQL